MHGCRVDILQFEEMSRLVDVFARAGVDRAASDWASRCAAVCPNNPDDCHKPASAISR
jgi:hypothetical protein